MICFTTSETQPYRESAYGPVYVTVKLLLVTGPGTASVTPPCAISTASLFGSVHDERSW